MYGELTEQELSDGLMIEAMFLAITDPEMDETGGPDFHAAYEELHVLNPLTRYADDGTVDWVEFLHLLGL